MTNLAQPADWELRSLYEQVVRGLDVERLVSNATQLVALQSHSGQEQEVAETYAEVLDRAGFSVELDSTFSESPSVIAKHRTAPDGLTLQLAGHLDTVSTLHDAPWSDGKIIHGRGSCDMKGGLAVIAEVAHLLTSSAINVPLSCLVTAYGQHEEVVPGRELHEPLRNLLERGLHGDACIIPEGPNQVLPVSGKGSVIFEARFRRPGESSHEVLGEHPAEQNPVMAGHAFIAELEVAARGWTLSDKFVGKESFFIGKFQGGDLYNRVPTEVVLAGTRRYPLGRQFEDVCTELNRLTKAAAAQVGVEGTIAIQKSGQPFQLDETEPVVSALQRGHRIAVDAQLPLGGIRYSADASHFFEIAGVPAAYHGPAQSSAHADSEWVEIAQLERCTRVLVAAALAYYLDRRNDAVHPQR